MPQDNLLMFQVRYNIEKQLNRIWEQRFENNEFDTRIKHQPVIRIIQDLLRHNSKSTIMPYTYIMNKQIAKIGSPLDKLDWNVS